jgi:CheY-like chemotaxis protein
MSPACDRLMAEGYSVETAGDGNTAIARATGEPFDVIVLDVMLPSRDGFDVAKTLRQNGIQTPILMLTARSQVVDRVVGLKLGADDYLTKPFETIELLARLEALLRRPLCRWQWGAMSYNGICITGSSENLANPSYRPSHSSRWTSNRAFGSWTRPPQWSKCRWLAAASRTPAASRPAAASRAPSNASGVSSTSNSGAVERRPASNTSVPRGCSTRKAGTGMRISPLRPLPIVAASLVSHPHSRGRTRTAMRGTLCGGLDVAQEAAHGVRERTWHLEVREVPGSRQESQTAVANARVQRIRDRAGRALVLLAVQEQCRHVDVPQRGAQVCAGECVHHRDDPGGCPSDC